MHRFPHATLALAICVSLTAAGCRKSDAPAIPGDAITPEGAPALDLAAQPQLLFELFGDRDDLRLIPVAAVVGGKMTAIGLTSRGWRRLDSMYLAPGTKYPVYHEDQVAGEVVVSKGMWNGGGPPQFPQPGCKSLKPLAAAKIALKEARSDPYIEMLASTAALAAHAPYKGKLLTEAEIAKVGREFGHRVAALAQLDGAELDSLDFHARLLVTGAAAEPTLLVSFIDPNAGNLGPGAGRTVHLFALGEKVGEKYEPSYRHAVSGNGREVEFQRIVDHIDINGDGVDEMVLESWRYGAAQPETVVLAFSDGQWKETVRVKQYCLDAVRAKK